MQFFATFLAIFIGCLAFAPANRDDDGLTLVLTYITFALFAAWARVA